MSKSLFTRGFRLNNRSTKKSQSSVARMARQRLDIERLEDRRVLAAFALEGINANDGSLLVDGETRTIAPTDLTLVFTRGNTVQLPDLTNAESYPIQVVRSGFDGDFTNDNEVVITPGFVGLGESENEVIVRFSESLPDDAYQIRIFGTGPNALEATAGGTTCTFNDSADRTVSFELDLGANVVSVVPQPITRLADGTLSQAKDQIEVYFNDDDLATSSATNPEFYQLIFTGHANDFDPSQNTLSNSDDVVINPASVTYDAAADKAVLTFRSDLDLLPTGVGTYRLRIGSNEARAVEPRSITSGVDAGSSFTSADATIGTLTAQGVIVGGEIAPQGESLVFPGSNQDPGHRRVSTDFDLHVRGSADVDPAIPLFAYNFQDVIGINLDGGDIQNLITENQKELVRQVFEIYAHYLGIEFVETDNAGITVATGDVRAVVPLAFTDPDLVPGVAGASTAVMNSAAAWSDDFGGNYYQEAMRQIGRVLGYGASNDLPDGTVQGSNPALTFGIDAEPIFPGDHDLVHGRYLFSPDGNDIDLYRFELTEAGTISIETFAERRAQTSSLDTVLRLYRQSSDGPVLVSQNDDYFGEDSRISLRLTSGTYFIGVSSKGNDRYDPTIENSGAGGTSQGRYEMRLDFRPAVNESLVDTTGQPLDGDGDGQAGGNFNFWFRVQSDANTIFVDKDHPSTQASDGSLNRPYDNIRDAVADVNASPGVGEIIRVVGNNLDSETMTDRIAYEIGFSSLNETPLEDGGLDGSLRIPRTVTMMVDAGAVFKMRRGAIGTGSSSAFVDDSGSTFQVLGTPQESVIFTSHNDESIGNDTNNLTTSPLRGDWGGILLRKDIDVARGLFDYEASGIFLNSINFADMRFGGGVVSNNFVTGVVNPITMIGSRAAVAYNQISFAADAAMSASPSTFEESTFQPASGMFTSDYSRVGPDIRANHLTTNTTNGLSVANRFGITSAGLQLLVAGRFNDTSVVHVIQDNLEIVGTAGGTLGEFIDVDGETVLVQTARPDGSLVVDPGIVIKAESSAITVGLGANLYAEGTNQRPIVVTSILDDRFGFGGTFDTNGDASAAAPEPANWAGFHFAPSAAGSFDHVVMAYGGGVATVAGAFSGFNVIESHQAALRVTNSVFEFNGRGTGGVTEENRVGLGPNSPGTIFVAGEQPIIVDNIFRSNLDAIISVNVNALNHESVVDVGRSTGQVDIIGAYQDNQGPLVREVVLENNGVNAMVVRGGTLTTESVWDDTDVVHGLFDTIFVPNFHTFGGLRLKSSPDASLVVKLLGGDSSVLLGENGGGFVATGSASGTPDHIGGGVQIIGQPGNPVILTSLFDDTVGAGIDSQGDTQADTDNGGRPVRTSDDFQILLNFGPVIRQFPEIVQAARKAADLWEAQFQDAATISIDVELGDLGPAGGLLLEDFFINEGVRLFDTDTQFLAADYNLVRDALVSDAGAHEEIVSQLPASNQLNVNFPADPTNPFSLSDEMLLTRANAKALNLLGILNETASQYNPLNDLDASIVINDNLVNFDFDLKNGLATFREDFQTNFLREIGQVLGFESGANNINFALFVPEFDRNVRLTPLDLFRFDPGVADRDFTTATRQLDPRVGDHVFYAGGRLDFTGFPLEGINLGEIPLSDGFFDPEDEELNDSFGAGFWLDEFVLRNDKLTIQTPIGVMDPRTGLRDDIIFVIDPVQTTESLIVDISEADRLAFDSIGYDAVGPTPGHWAGIRFEEFSNDRNVPVYPEVESPSSPIPGPNDVINSAEFIGDLAPNQQSGDDDTRLGFEVHGLISAPGDVDIYEFSAQPGTMVWIDIDNTAVGLDSVVELVAPDGAVLARSDNSHVEQTDPTTLVGSAEVTPLPLQDDIYTTSIYDAGMQLTLPGSTGLESNYLVRVRAAGDTAEDVTGGKTSGRYELQVRLQSADEVPGSSVVLSEIRYARTGVKIIGPPTQSPLLGEHAETAELNDAPFELNVVQLDAMGVPVDPIEDNTFFSRDLPVNVQAQPLGNLLASRQGAFSVFGTISEPLDVDWYRFELNYDDLALPPDNTFPSDEVGIVFDIDFADGLGRPDTVLAVYDANLDFLDFFNFNDPELLFFSDNSNISADQASNNQQLSDLSRGSLGQGDPFIGPVVLNAGRDVQNNGLFGFVENSYYVAVASAFQLPRAVVDGTAQSTPILGDPNRGQAVAPGVTDTAFAINPQLVPGVLQGEYQLEIRTVPIPEGGFTAQNVNATIADVNRDRPQGQLIVSSNVITDSLNWGITVEDGFRDLPFYLGDLFVDPDNVDPVEDILDLDDFRSRPHTQFTTGNYTPHTGAPRAIPGLNEERLVPGITISNNLIAGGREGGVQMHGDPNGIVITTFGLDAIIDIEEDFGTGEIEGLRFTIWDHQRDSATFELTGDATVGVGSDGRPNIPVRFDNTLPDGIDSASTNASVLPATLAQTMAQEIEHAVRRSDLDIKTYRGSDNTVFLEGAVEIGVPDVIPPGPVFNTPFFPVDSMLRFTIPLFTADKVQQGAVTYARIVNNTLVGRSGTLGLPEGAPAESIGDIGIEIGDNASPTLLNNIITNFDVGIQADLSSDDSIEQRKTFVGGNFSLADGTGDFEINSIPQEIVNDADVFEPFLVGHGLSHIPIFFGSGLGDQGFNDFDDDASIYVGSRPTIVGGTLYKNNLTDAVRIGVGDFPIRLSDDAALFVNAQEGNYFLAPDAAAIDSSVSFLPERSSLNQLLSFLELESEGIAAPRVDAMGITRVDDPRVEPPNGLGNNVFIDRGALERADFVNPVARLVNPLDNDTLGIDQDTTLNSVLVIRESLTSFDIRLAEPVFGTGIDDTTVMGDSVTIITEERTLVEGVDYTFAYNSVTDTIRLTPVAGIWPTDTIYRVAIRNSDEIDPDTGVVLSQGIKDRGENPLSPNRPDGTTAFVIAIGSGGDFGDAPDPSFPTLRSSNGARHAVQEGVFLGQGVDVEVEASTNVSATADAFDDGVVFTSESLVAGAPLRITVTASVAGLLNAWVDFNDNDSWEGGEQIFADEPLVAGANSLVSLVPSSAVTGVDTYARFRFSTQPGLQPTGEAPDGEVEDYVVNVVANDWQNPSDPFDVNGDGNPGGSPGPQDALDIINVLTNIATDTEVVGVNGETGALTFPRPANAGGFYDVDGDGFVTPLDALLVINRLGSNNGSAARAASSGGTGAGVVFDPAMDDEDESLESVIDQIAGDVGDVWSTE